MNRLLLTVRNILAIAVIGVVANVLSMLIMQFFVITDFEIRFVVAYVIPMTLVLCGVAIYDSRVAGHKERCMLRASGFDPVALLWGIILIVALSVVLAPLMRLLPENNRNIPTGLFTMLCVVVVAPIFEEILFRDRVFSVLRSTLSPWWAAVVSALIFGAMHGNLVVAIEAFCVGIVLSYLYILKGSLFAPILLHIMNNVVAYVMMTFKYQEHTIEDFIGDLPMFSTIYIVSAVVVLLGTIHIGYLFRKAHRVVADGGELIGVSRGKIDGDNNE